MSGVLVEVIGTPKRLLQEYSQATGDTPDDIVFNAVLAYIDERVRLARKLAGAGDNGAIRRVAAIRLRHDDEEATP